MNRERATLALLAFGFVTLGLEVRYEHRYVVEAYWEGWIPVGYSAAAILASIFGMVAKGPWRGIAATIFTMGIGIGAFGTYKHLDGKPNRLAVLVSTRPQDSEQDEAPPMLAPMGIAGLSAIGLVVSSGKLSSR